MRRWSVAPTTDASTFNAGSVVGEDYDTLSSVSGICPLASVVLTPSDPEVST
jgi:hypothetical protein